MSQAAFARARANIALAKYWGKSDVALNLPAVPSISLTLDGLVTETTVRFREDLDADLVKLDGRVATAKEAARVVELLDRVRAAAKLGLRAEVESTNRFPTAAGLASSASGFAALAAAAAKAAGLRWGTKKLSAAARQSSASAARSLFGGFAKLPAGAPGQADLAAKPLYGPEHWDVRLVVAEAAKGPKKVGSTEGMERSRRTSPLYDAWVEKAPALTRRIQRALKDKDLDALGAAMEQSTYAFHACAMSASPGILYWQPATLAALRTVERLREKGTSVWATMDAGPHVKALCHAADAAKVRRALGRTEGVLKTMVAKPGAGIEVEAR
ncbi:MAG TPA: diphosphomevalonate decarboxylase [Polyangiaceae bacterium LLY-WYZ-15_(1-7)]|nr:diphosphomevalonate decarboxylase [Myxococcales bacterium]MAT25567.1 diphosphomevalonate decarboxylase [Sandaracinus sp.]HJL05032.1 diphosphomevalonate decarboxylase [Polyangiaceae bacterium LLY-WYZ-15_(1-7)]MBJ74947.1 diphosphomevalonate decarboxylase [Sandaracinus sp.]HJL07149.1 diphosphomevalonate decarboxylase [Polyangiaceae bacterium LLY-WYZ-15_(1-7)]